MRPLRDRGWFPVTHTKQPAGDFTARLAGRLPRARSARFHSAGGVISQSQKRGETMTFYEWMMTKYLGKDTPRGDLAEDMKRVKDFPEKNTR